MAAGMGLAVIKAMVSPAVVWRALGAGARENAARYDWPRIAQRRQEVYATL